MKKTSRRYRLAQNKKRFRQKKVDYSRYVKDFYLEDGLAYISCNVEGYHDIIHPHSVIGYEWLNETFANFVESNAFYIPVEYPIVLKICGCRFSKKRQETIKETISDYYELKLGDKQLDLNNNTQRILVFIICGILAILITSLIKGEGLFNEHFGLLVWFFIWELLDLIVYERRDLQEEKMAAAQLASIIVTFREEFVDEPFDEEEQQIYDLLEEEGL